MFVVLFRSQDLLERIMDLSARADEWIPAYISSFAEAGRPEVTALLFVSWQRCAAQQVHVCRVSILRPMVLLQSARHGVASAVITARCLHQEWPVLCH